MSHTATNEFQFSPAQSTDLAKLSELVNSAYRGDSSKAGWTTEADLLGGQRTDPVSLANMLHDSSVILLARAAGSSEILGCVFLERISGKAYLGMLTVKPTLQNQGLGKKLLFAAVDFVRTQWQARALRITVINLRHELLSWYERHGFVRTGEVEAFPYGDERFGQPKRDDLQFLVLEKPL